MSSRWSPNDRLALVERLQEIPGANSQSFFDAHGLGADYRKAGDKNSRRAKVNAALHAAEMRGDVDVVLDAASLYLGGPQLATEPERLSVSEGVLQVTEAAGADPELARKVFVVHGRNEPARVAMFTFLRALGLAPIEWSEALAMTGEASPYIGHVLDTALSAAQAIVVLLTPDDVAYLRTEYASGPDDPDTNPTAQARPNVLFEAGMAMGRDAKRTVLVELGKLRPFSDVAGRHAVRMTNTPQSRTELAGRLRTAGCNVNTDGTDWLTAGDFTPPPEPGGGLPLGKRLPSTTGPAGVRLDARYHDRSSGGVLEIINQGAEAVHDINVEVPDGVQGLHIIGHGLPILRLPSGKSFMVPCVQTMDSNSNYIDLIITGRTASGEPIHEEAFVSLVG